MTIYMCYWAGWAMIVAEVSLIIVTLDKEILHKLKTMLHKFYLNQNNQQKYSSTLMYHATLLVK